MNNNSVVLRLSMGRVSFLLTGDIEQEGEMELVMGRANVRGTVLKVGHHGSATSTSEEFLAVVSPRLAVISVGKDNGYGHPTQGVVARLKRWVGQDSVYRTDEDGTIQFITDGERLWVKTERR
jgi:competence protein ComEC